MGKVWRRYKRADPAARVRYIAVRGERRVATDAAASLTIAYEPPGRDANNKIHGLGMLSAPMPRHICAMAQSTYDVFIQHNGNYGVALSVRGAMVRTMPDFASESDARAWVARDQRPKGSDIPSAKHKPSMPHAH